MGVGLLIGGVIFNATGSRLSDKADEAYAQARRTEDEVNKITGYFDELSKAAKGFQTSLTNVEKAYRDRLSTLNHIITFSGKTQWIDFSEKEKVVTQNLVLLVGLLYKMCQVNLVIKSENEEELNKVNQSDINEAIRNAEKILMEIEVV